MTADGAGPLRVQRRMVLATPRGRLTPGSACWSRCATGCRTCRRSWTRSPGRPTRGAGRSSSATTAPRTTASAPSGRRARVPLRIVDSREAVGRAGALAVAARVARGQFLLFCDADDIVADDWVERMKAALDRWPAVGGYLDEESLNPPSVLAWRPRATPGELPCPFGLLPAPIGANCGVWRDAYEEVGGFDLSFRGAAAEETDLFWRLQLAGYQLGYAPDAVVAYRHRPRPALACSGSGAATGGAGPTWSPATRRWGCCPRSRGRTRSGPRLWLAVHAVDCVRGPARRANYLRILAHVVGQVEGSRESGVLHIRRGSPPPGHGEQPPGPPATSSGPRRRPRPAPRAVRAAGCPGQCSTRAAARRVPPAAAGPARPVRRSAGPASSRTPGRRSSPSCSALYT